MKIFSLKRLFAAYHNLARIPRMAAAIGMIVLAVYLVVEPAQAFMLYLTDSKAIVAKRRDELVSITDKLNRYQQLRQRLASINSTFEKSQLSFEGVTVELDKMVKNVVGIDDYTLRVGGAPITVGEQYERQDFTLTVRGMNAQQIVDLLYNLQQGQTPLFLGKVDLTKTSGKEAFDTTLEIFSVGHIKS